MQKQSHLILIILFSTIFGYSQSKQALVESFIKNQKLYRNSLGVYIKALDADSVIVSINADTLYNPASVAKLITGAAAFDLLGTNHTFKTQLFRRGTFNIDSGILSGDLYIKGNGDPTFTAERLWLFCQHIRHIGIRKITGNIILDDFAFDSVTIGPGFDEDSSSRAYEPLISALSMNFNTIAIYHSPGTSVGSPLHVEIFPRIKGITVQSTGTTGTNNKKSEQIETLTSQGKTVVKITGSMSLLDKPQYTYRKLWSTWEAFGGGLAALFDESGIEFKGKFLHARTPDSIMSCCNLYCFESDPLKKVVESMFKYSSNFAAEMVFKSISRCTDSSTGGSWPGGSKTVLSWWKAKNLISLPQIRNGSGMGNTNRLSVKQTSELLEYVYQNKSYYPEYLQALSTSGVDGTLKSRFKKSPLVRLVRGKTGTLNNYGVSTLAGYVLTPNQTYAFAIFCNRTGLTQYENWVLQERILEKAIQK